MYNINSSVLEKTGYTAVELQNGTNAVRKNGFDDFQAFVDAENKYGISSLYLLAHACEESAWATEQIQPNNLFGFNANDADPKGDASEYASQAQCIDEVAGFLKTNYLTEGGVDYNGDTLHDIFIKYSSSHDTEATTVAEIMNLIAGKIGTPTETPEPTPAPTQPASETYTVVEGDNLSEIASKHGLTLTEIEKLNPQLAPDFSLIHPGQVVNLSAQPDGFPQPAPATPTEPTEETYTAVEGDTVWGICEKFGISTANDYQAFRELNPGFVNLNVLAVGKIVRIK